MRFIDSRDVLETVEEEGVGCFLTGYCRASAMPDECLKKAFEEAEDAIRRFLDLARAKQGDI